MDKKQRGENRRVGFHNHVGRIRPPCVSLYWFPPLPFWHAHLWLLVSPTVLLIIRVPRFRLVGAHDSGTRQQAFANHTSVSNNYQSNGACEQTCATYALAILQGKECWCSNVAPSESSQTGVTDCNTGCPGYPADSCGSASKGVFAYVQVSGNSIISTAGGSSSSTSTTTSSVSFLCCHFTPVAYMLSRWTLPHPPFA